MSTEIGTTLPRAGEHLVVVVAHPDDESFGCGSAIALAVARGARVTLICGTRGEAGERVADPATDRLPLGEVREHELRAAASVLGVSAVELLDHADSGFGGPLPDGALCSLTVEELASELGRRFDELQPDVVLIVDGTDGHRDHIHVRDAVHQLVSTHATGARELMWSIPNSLMRRWIDEMRSLNPDAAYLDLDLEALGRADADVTAVDVSAQLPVREAAIACHQSQRSPFDGLSPELRRAFLATDYFVTS
jgi:LmbE family N-acetylglucosaminyl deacetylase